MKTQNQFHKAFKLQGESFNSSQELLVFSKSISFEIHTFLTDWFNTSLFIEVNTSGSTGKPKVIQLQKEHMKNSAKATGFFFNLCENTTALLCMSPKYIAGKMMLVRALTLGWNLDVVEVNSNPLKNNNNQYDFAAMVPMQLHNSLAKIQNIKKLIVGGGVVSKELLKPIQNVTTEVFATYGMTETITHIAVKKLNNIRHAELDSVCHYNILPNISISIDTRGCLVIDAPKIASGKIVTNDLVELISETEFKWLGRFDTIINSGGIKLIPEQIEEKLSKVISQRFFLAGIKDAVLGEKLVLIIEMSVTKLNKQNLLKKLKRESCLTKYEFPKEIYSVDTFIETETQKINRVETLEILAKNFN